MVDCGSGHCVAGGTTSTKQTSRRWAAMRLLQELSYTLDPAFFKNTPEGTCAAAAPSLQRSLPCPHHCCMTLDPLALGIWGF